MNRQAVKKRDNRASRLDTTPCPPPSCNTRAEEPAKSAVGLAAIMKAVKSAPLYDRDMYTAAAAKTALSQLTDVENYRVCPSTCEPLAAAFNARARLASCTF